MSINPQNNRDLNQDVLHAWFKFGDSSWNQSQIIARTSSWLTPTWRRQGQYPKAKTGLWYKLSVKNYGRESVNGDFPCSKLENAKKIRQNFFGRLWKKLGLILINMFRPTYVPNLVTLDWKMSSGMSKEAGSLNGPLCAYLMRQNLHDRTCPRSYGNKCPR